ncbi:MAG: hypothetical protein JSW33_09995 [bacterium]|nr:MAG: hypothetical protein JSW33_09995 [bacterium]
MIKFGLSLFWSGGLLALITTTSCGQQKNLLVTYPALVDTLNVPPPKPIKIHAYSEYFDKQVTLQVEEALDFSRQVQNLTHSRSEAKNVDSFEQVANSSWFTNRNGTRRMSPAQIRHGPNAGEGPDTAHAWTITRAKMEGVTPGFSIRDYQGDNYVIKFDPLGYPELASGAEVVSTKLFYAMGYNTPENYIVYFDPKKLQLGEKVSFTDKKGRKRYMNPQDLKELLERIEKLPDGRIRALASKYLDGKPIGPFKYKGIRKDDLNDFIPHEDRRELRGLRIFAAWLNHFDTKDGNSLDMYVTENEKSFVRHYLIDFGATLGSASKGPNFLWRGYQYDVDPGVILSNIFTLGLYVRPWEKQPGVIYPSIGIFESKIFDPMAYKPQVPNPAFQSMTLSDGFWAAKIVMSFSDEQLEAIIEEGQYSNPLVESYLLQTLKERRDKIGRHFFSRLSPLDEFGLQHESDGLLRLEFKDLAMSSNLDSGAAKYRYEVIPLAHTDLHFEEGEVIGDTLIYLQNTLTSGFSSGFKGGDSAPIPKLCVRINKWAYDQNKWMKPVLIFINYQSESNKFEIIGIRRES